MCRDSRMLKDQKDKQNIVQQQLNLSCYLLTFPSLNLSRKMNVQQKHLHWKYFTWYRLLIAFELWISS